MKTRPAPSAVVWCGSAKPAPSWKELASQCQGRWLVSWTQCPTEPVAHGGEPYLRHHLSTIHLVSLEMSIGIPFPPTDALETGRQLHLLVARDESPPQATKIAVLVRR